MPVFNVHHCGGAYAIITTHHPIISFTVQEDFTVPSIYLPFPLLTLPLLNGDNMGNPLVLADLVTSGNDKKPG